jgi:hypothetical protein
LEKDAGEQFAKSIGSTASAASRAAIKDGGGIAMAAHVLVTREIASDRVKETVATARRSGIEL